MYKEPADLMGYIVISPFVVFFLFIVLVFFLSDKETKGALFLTKKVKATLFAMAFYTSILDM